MAINQEAVGLMFRNLDLTWDERLKVLNTDELRTRWIAAWEEAVGKGDIFPHMPKPIGIYMAMPGMTLLWFTVMFAVPQYREGGPKYWIR